MAESTRRVFLALWPGDDVATRLSGLATAAHQSCGGRQMRRDTLHLTLAFLGDVAEGRLPALCAAMTAVRGEAFSLRIDRLGYWPHNHIVWGGCSSTPPQLLRLVADVREALAGAGFAHAGEAAFVPHLTLLRKARPSALPDFTPIDWPVAGFALVASTLSPAGPAYVQLAAWPLA
ncbi:RNA 2',3'-cyclic phosphodiesterase [Zoogloea oryzae]|uniref:RNA 2',3'-cyclic phosphodiesterase n=1 Tax=Zoogloea oryzae TaxID=310767 RepID=A0ABQ6FA29_9RHOO|nr:RNA 2',3'-cyclic phosphodiesterase [Zoogloea oryzae]GLT21425.1 RNA 2',3'-cyclic phosphodiesterase [Zoogloea oryzae]